MRTYTIGTCQLVLEQGDITQEQTEAVANAANALLRGGGGVDGAIHRAAGADELQAALSRLKGELRGGVLHTGGAVATPGFKLRASTIIHCVGPIYERDKSKAPQLLAACYRNALGICRELALDSIAFPSISTGVYGYPVGEAAEVALGSVRDELAEYEKPRSVRFVLFDDSTLAAYIQAANLLLSH